MIDTISAMRSASPPVGEHVDEEVAHAAQLAGGGGRVERLDVVEDAEDRAQRHAGALGHLLGGGAQHALAEQVEQRVDGEVAAAVATGSPAVDGGLGGGHRRGHDP